jgi:hypothetical protein
MKMKEEGGRGEDFDIKKTEEFQNFKKKQRDLNSEFPLRNEGEQGGL